MIDTFRHIFTPFKPYWKSVVVLFIVLFSVIYYTGYTIEWIAMEWEDGTNDIEKLYDIGTMLIHGVFPRALASLWSMAPFWVTLVLTMAIITLYFAYERADKEGRGERFGLITGIVKGIVIILVFYFIVLK